MSPDGLLPWLKARLTHCDASDSEYAERLQDIDTELEAQRRRRVEYRRRISVAERKYRGYAKPVHK